MGRHHYSFHLFIYGPRHGTAHDDKNYYHRFDHDDNDCWFAVILMTNGVSSMGMEHIGRSDLGINVWAD